MFETPAYRAVSFVRPRRWLTPLAKFGAVTFRAEAAMPWPPFSGPEAIPGLLFSTGRVGAVAHVETQAYAYTVASAIARVEFNDQVSVSIGAFVESVRARRFSEPHTIPQATANYVAGRLGRGMSMSDRHILRKFDVDLNLLSSRLLEMGGLVESQIALAMEALDAFDLLLVEQVPEGERRLMRWK
jgi:hypothetical protein